MQNISFDYRRFLSFLWGGILILISIFPVYIYIGNPLFTPGRLIVIFLVLIFFALLLNRNFSRDYTRLLSSYKCVFFLFHSYFFFRVLSVFWSEDVVYALGSVTLEFSQMYLCFVFGCLASYKANSNKLALLVFLIVFLFGFQEYLTEYNALRLLASGDSVASIAAQTVSFRGEYYRSQAFFEHPLSLAHYYLIVLVYVALLMPRYVIYFVFIAFLGVLSTDSRAALGILCLAVFLSSINKFLNPRLRTYFLTCGVFFVFTFILLGVDFLPGQGEEELASSATRAKQWVVGIELIFNESFFGVGVGDAAVKLLNYSQFQSSFAYLWRASIDSYILLRIIESGFVCGVLLLGIFSCLFYKFMIAGYFNNNFSIALPYYLLAISIVIYIVSPLYTVSPLFFWLSGLMLRRKDYEDGYEC